jgi:hypothetical protein
LVTITGKFWAPWGNSAKKNPVPDTIPTWYRVLYCVDNSKLIYFQERVVCAAIVQQFAVFDRVYPPRRQPKVPEQAKRFTPSISAVICATISTPSSVGRSQGTSRGRLVMALRPCPSLVVWPFAGDGRLSDAAGWLIQPVSN